MMATNDVAAQWLRDNEKLPKTISANKATGPWFPKGRVKPLCLEPLEHLAWDEQVRRVKPSGGHISPYKAKIAPLNFLRKNLKTDKLQCIFYPGAAPGKIAHVNYGGVYMAAARAMCAMAHGAPNFEGAVARHLCGWGHYSCVNPNHLRWGDAEDNAQDRILHRTLPEDHPEHLTDALAEDIRNDPRLANIVAIEYQVHAHLVRLIRAGEYPVSGSCDEERQEVTKTNRAYHMLVNELFQEEAVDHVQQQSAEPKSRRRRTLRRRDREPKN